MKTSHSPVFLPQVPANTLEFKYDDAGNRIKKSASGGDTTYYINAGLSVLNELDARGEVSKTIVQGLSQIAEIDAQGRITFIHSDVLGSAMFVSDEAGAVVQQYDYDPFGSLIGSLGAADGSSQTKYQFTGQEFDSESNLGYFNARYYSPTLGRFLSRDSYLGQDGDTLGRNRYNYVKNNPLKYVDPTGNEAVGAQAEEYGSEEMVSSTLIADSGQIMSDVKKSSAKCSMCFDITADLIQKLKKNGKEMSDAYTHDLLEYNNALEEAAQVPWYFPTNKAGAYLSASLTYEAERASTYLQLYNHVKPYDPDKPGGDWDYKIGDYERYKYNPIVLAGVSDERILFDARGNINFGFTGIAAGIPETTLLSGAGIAQIAVGTSKSEWWSSYFDDPNDAIFIKIGIDLYRHFRLNIDEAKLKKTLEWHLNEDGFYLSPDKSYWD